MKKFLVLIMLIACAILTNSASAKGVYYNNTIYNLDNVVSVAKINSTTLVLTTVGNKQITLYFKTKAGAKQIFDAIQVVIL